MHTRTHAREREILKNEWNAVYTLPGPQRPNLQFYEEAYDHHIHISLVCKYSFSCKIQRAFFAMFLWRFPCLLDPQSSPYRTMDHKAMMSIFHLIRSLPRAVEFLMSIFLSTYLPSGQSGLYSQTIYVNIYIWLRPYVIGHRTKICVPLYGKTELSAADIN